MSHQLTTAINRLTEHVQLLTHVFDELLTELRWRNNQFQDGHHSSCLPITSMPADPAAKNWQINRVKPDSSPHKQTLFD